jgi:hypothetical protein
MPLRGTAQLPHYADRMNSLTHIEKRKLERELRMSGGYVLDFSNRTFAEFFRDVLGVEIYSPRYNLGSGSKANRMRAFWQHATDTELRRLFQGILEGWDIYSGSPIGEPARTLLTRMVKKLGGDTRDIEEPDDDDTTIIGARTSDRLTQMLLSLTALSPQDRGFAYERFLKDLFNAYKLSARASFRLSGEQIDGSFVLHHETYLLEAKWQNAPVGATDLHSFEGKLGEKASWSRGLFVSNSGFSQDGLHAFGRGKRVICMDGYDLSEMIGRRLSFVVVIEAKVRRAAETGKPLVSVRELFG